ncbi:MAG: hypothetical protein WB803_05165, partial [Pseudolabrys sp.]
MKLRLSVVSLLVAALPICAQAQVPQTPQTPKAPKASKEPKGAVLALSPLIVLTMAEKQNDMRKIDELNSKKQALA